MGESVLQAANVWKSYKEHKAVKDFSLQISAGEIVGMVGPNGAGKTTFMECCQGLTPFEAGSITLFGEDIRRGLSARTRQRVGVAPQFFSLPPLLTVSEILSVYHALYDRARPAMEILERVGLAQQAKTRFARLSGGQQRRLAVAVALIGNPELVFLDEPTGDLDPQSRRYIWDILREENSRAGRAVLMTTHQMDEVETLCSQVVIVDEGRILETGSPQALINRHCPQHALSFDVSVADCAEVQKQLADVVVSYAEEDPLFAKASLIRPDSGAALQQLLYLQNTLNLAIKNLLISKSSLEDVFIKLTGKSLRE